MEIKEEVKGFRKKIDTFNENINLLIKILEKIKQNMEIYYKINYDMINNYNNDNINYQILENINEIKNNIRVTELDEITNENNINNKFKYLFDLYQKMTKEKNDKNDENVKNDIQYIEMKDYNIITTKDNINEIEMDKPKELGDEICIIYKPCYRLKIFGKEFVEKNKAKCKIFYKEKLNDLTEEIYPSDSSQKKDTFNLKLIGINKITSMSRMFDGCEYLLSLPDISKWKTFNITNMSYMFYNCKSLISLSDISLWDTSKITDISYMFSGCSSLKSLPDIS